MVLHLGGDDFTVLEHSVVLIADADPDNRRQLCKNLASQHYKILEASCGSDVFSLLRRSAFPDLIIIKDSFPDMTGVELCNAIRTCCFAPVLFMSEKTDLELKQKAYGSGGDDYLLLPCSQEELFAKVSSLLRRYLIYRGKIIEFHGICIDFEARTVSKNGTPINLTDIEFSILKFLFSKKGTVVSTQEIYENVWGESFFFPDANTVMVHILNLRKKLEDSVSHPQIIRTIWGKGYKLCV